MNPGHFVDPRERDVSQVVSGCAFESIPAGYAVSIVAGLLVVATGQHDVLGIAMGARISNDGRYYAPVCGFNIGDSVGVLRVGRAFVAYVGSGDVTYGTPARVAADGRFTTDPAGTLVPRTIFTGLTTSTGIATVSINAP